MRRGWSSDAWESSDSSGETEACDEAVAKENGTDSASNSKMAGSRCGTVCPVPIWMVRRTVPELLVLHHYELVLRFDTER